MGGDKPNLKKYYKKSKLKKYWFPQWEIKHIKKMKI